MSQPLINQMGTYVPSLEIHSPSTCWHQAHLNQAIVQPYSYELSVHIEVLSNIPLSLELNPSLVFPLKTLRRYEAIGYHLPLQNQL